MTPESSALVWLDMEMTGLDPDRDRVIELAIIVTNGELDILAESPVWAVHQDDSVLAAMDEWNQSTHGQSGLIDRVRASVWTEEMVEQQALAFLRPWVSANQSPLCGNSICQDRRFMARWMPQLEAYFHYRNLDVSTLKELFRRWRPDLGRGFEKQSSHQALADIRESIQELQYYREHFLIMPPR